MYTQIQADNKIMRYYGSTELQFKKRYSKQKSSFKKKPEWENPFKTSAFYRGEGVKNLPNLPMDSSKNWTVKKTADGRG